MQPLQPGAPAPAIPGSEAGEDPRVLLFYKVTCQACQMSAPVAERLHQQLPGRLVGIGQDPPEKLEEFRGEYATSFASVSDAPPYELSDAYGVRTVPTLFVVEDGTVVDTVESWDRDGWNRVARGVAERVGSDAEDVSWESDGLPPFRPG